MTELTNIRKDLDALAKRLERLEQKEQKAHEFIKGDIVLARDSAYSRWKLDIFDSINNSNMTDYKYGCEGNVWKQIKPAYIPGVYNRWTGGKCPVSGDTLVTVWNRDGAVANKRIAGMQDWEHEDSGLDIVGFMIMPEKQDDTSKE